jgi:hypothetical protein
MAEKGKVGDVDVKDILSKDTVDLKKLDDNGLADVTKEAYKKDSVSFDILEGVSKIADTVAKFIKDPMNVVVTGYGESAQTKIADATGQGVARNTIGN